jgi:hypothetical protein
MGVKISFTVNWPASTAAAAGSGPVNIWLLSHSTGTTMLMGTSQTCESTLPDLPLAGAGLSAVNGNGTTVQIDIPVAKTWANVSRTFADTGTQSGFNPGATFDVNAAVGLLGLTNASYAGNLPTTQPPAWPDESGCTANCACTGTGKGSAATFSGTCGVFPAADVTDDDGDGNPGITSYPFNGMMNSVAYTYPPTTVTFFATPPLADQLYIVSRNELQLTGTRMTDCNHGGGSVSVTLFDNHVVGCHATATSTNGDLSFTGPAGPCDSGQTAFVDQNRPIYGTASGPASTSNPISGTFTGLVMAAGTTCAEVIAALP